MRERRFRHLPRSAAIGRAKDAGCRASAGEPDIVSAFDGDTGSAGGKGAFARQSFGTRGVRQLRPVRAAVVGGQQFETTIDWISNGDAMVAIPEREAIVKAFGIGVRELQRPVLAGVGGFVDARLIAGSRGA